MVNAQSNNATTGTNTISNYTKLFSEGKEFQRCLIFTPDQCSPIVTVLYERPTFITLQSKYIDSIWKAVDLIEKDGYKIQGLTSYSITSDVGRTSKNYVNLLVVLSNNTSN
jgi:hypothetical protein